MKAMLSYINAQVLTGQHPGLRGDCSGLRGNCSGLEGNCTNLRGNCSGLRGDCSGLEGNCSGLEGNCTGLWGDCTGLEGNLDVCELTDAERRAGVDITKLIAPRTGEEEETMGAYCRHGNLSGQPCGYCKQDEAKDARIAALEAALAKAREALGECHYRMPKGQTCECPKCAALAAIGEVFHD